MDDLSSMSTSILLDRISIDKPKQERVYFSMDRFWCGAAVAAVMMMAAGGGAVASGIFGQKTEGKFASVFRALEWDPTCMAPWLSGPAAVDDEQMHLYLACVNEQALADATAASNAIKEGRKKALRRALSEYDALRR
jgi:hypothetical protein